MPRKPPAMAPDGSATVLERRGAGERDIPAFDLETFFPYLVRVFYRAVSGAVSDVYTVRHGLSVSQWRTMAVLGPHRALSAGEIVAQSSMDKVNVSRAISSLREAGLLKRDIDGDDRRRAVLRLTDAGLAVYADLVPRMYEVEAAVLEDLSADERATLIALMEKVRKNALRRHGGFSREDD